METASLVAGMIFLILSTVARHMGQRNVNHSNNQARSIFSIPTKENPEDVYASIGQLMGILWIVIGIFLVLTEKWFSSSIAGIIAKVFVVLIPFLISGAIIKLLASNQTKK